ncbi:type III secretion system export apparatus subunit SctR [uncultured Desulfovibrio sp.]|uniref:type III secretion system export apparatus subunit SctR n=1 Tax=uncultured Desulfovibrio sp. TaxID=167968 RepID=UPI002632C5C7|nr:type III secretion system export apparatus subunit SctR [uncultured Desulfovibrio sp.]
MGFAGINPIYLVVGLAVLGLAPFMLMLVTSYVKIVVVTSLIRNALGVQQIPPTMVMNGLAIILTVFIMAPAFTDTLRLVERQKVSGSSAPAEVLQAMQNCTPPLRKFLGDNTSPVILNAFMGTARRVWPEGMRDDITRDNLLILVPAFTITELTHAFQMGFLLYLPFVAIDLIISNILLAMGMMMVSPMTISLPFKLLLFVTLDGWLKISQGLLLSYH